MIITKLNFIGFKRAFDLYGRGSQFPKGLETLFDYLEDLSDDNGEPYELDIIALCCEFQECSHAEVIEQTGCDDIDDVRDNHYIIEIDESTVLLGQ